MEAPLLREGAFSPEAAYYIDKLARKEEECNEITAQFNKYKVKTKVRFDQLRHEISNILHEKNVDPEDEQHNPAMLLISLNETQFRLEEAEKLSLALRSDVERQQVHINDQIILIKSLEEQLREYEESEIARERRRNEPVDLERVQQQMMYKDERIVELNSVILDKERQILDLQDACRSASEVATSKKEAMRIVQKKFDEMESRSRREASTETDDRLTGVSFDGATPAAATTERAQRSMQQPSQQPPPPRAVRTASPGRAVHVVNKNGCSSPPPLDPAKLDDLPGTSKLAMTKVDGDSSLLREKKQRKRVTFALDQAASREDISRLTADADTDEITEAIVNLTAENDRLRGEVGRMTRMEEEMEEMAIRVAQAESAVSEAEREARHASLKARAVAQARIKELEDRMAAQNALGAQQIDRLQVETETLRSTRDWEVEQNARMREQLAHTKEKLRQLREELDASAQANRVADKKLEEKELLLTSLVSELEEAESLAVFLEDQKHQILDDVDQLKDIIKLHEEQINLLEADNLIYETRVGHLREELGVSKINQRDHIKSKAFNTKLQMINKEKEQIDRKANDERLRTKALHAKVQILEAENERLMARLCEAEMAGEDSLSLDAACKQLQTRMEQAEAESTRVRTEFDARIHAAEFAADSLREECDKLRAERDSSEQQNMQLQQQYMQLQHDAQLQLQQLQQQQQYHQPGSTMQLLQRQEDSSAPLEAALKLAQTAQETLARERDELAERVHVLGSENFDLTRRTEEAEREVERLESELSRLESRLRESSASAAAADAERLRREERTVEREQELIDLRARVAERETTVERIEAELKRLRSELDHAHLSMAETAAVKKEVQHLQHQLEIEREAAATKWQQVMVQLKSYEELASNSGWDSRKTSIDETATVAAAAELRAARAEADAAAAREELRVLQQAQQSQPHHMQHVQQVQHEVPRRGVSTEEEDETVDRHEMDMLRARVEELESEVELSHELNVESGRTVQTLQQRLEKAEREKRLLESLTVEFSEDIADMGEAAAAAPVAAPSLQQSSHEESGELHKKIEELEEEATLSAELHVEMGRTVQALEGRIREMEMERRLHEMMSVELTTELHELRQLQQQQPLSPATAAEEPATDDAAAVKAAAAEQEAQLQQQLNEEKRQRVREQQAAREELHRLQMALHAAEDAKREVARQLAEKEQTESLVRATAATFDAVAAAAGSTVEVQTQSAPPADAAAAEAAEHEEERSTLVQENVLLREAVYQNVRHSESVTSDVARLLELKEELEKAVEALRGEIWSLNGQLKASAFDRENLQDRVVELDTKLSLEKRRAELLDVELAEQVELRENAQRQAAEAENESNRRLAECAEMDGKREDLEKAYALLAGYYSQLQEAYNVLYTQQQQQHVVLQQERLQQSAIGEGVSREDRSTQTDVAASAAQPSTSTASVTGAAPAAASSRRAMAEAYASRLAALRELSVQLTKSVLATELATLESELDNSITSIEGLSNDCPEAGASVDALLDAIIQDYEGSSAVSPDARAKIASVHAMLRAKISEVERVHSALREQRGVCTALEQRLTDLEAAGPPTGLVSPGGVSSSTVPSELEERIEECEALRAHVEQLQEIISRYVAREEAARLATREADVDSLFRSNAELAHENVRLQNELDEEKGEERREEKEKPETSSSSTQTHEQKDFDEAELELIKEELEAEREARRIAEKKMEETREEMKEQQEQLEESIVDLSMQLRDQRAAAPAANAAENEELEAVAAAAAARVAAMQEDLAIERAERFGVEKELQRKKEELEEMRTEMQLREADGDEMKLQLQQEREAKAAAEKKAKEAELQQAQLQEQLLKLQESKKEEDGWGSEGWGEEKDEESTSSSQQMEELRSQLQQEQTARVAAEQQLHSVETERLQLQDELSRLQELEKRVEVQQVQQTPKDDDGWGNEGWGEEEEKEDTKGSSTSKEKEELADLRDKLEWERTAREEAEEGMKKMEEELREEKERGEMAREKRREAEEREEETRRRMKEMEERKEDKDEPMEDDGWGNDGWGEEKESSQVDQSEALSQLQQLLQQETAARLAAEQARDELQRLLNEKDEEGGSGWGEEWGEQKSSSVDHEALSSFRVQLQQSEKKIRELEKDLRDAAELREQLREEIEVLEEENSRMTHGETEGEEGVHCTAARRHRQEMEGKEQEITGLHETYMNRVEELESQLTRERDTTIKYEKIMHDRKVTIEWLKQTIGAMEKGEPIPPPPVDSDGDEDVANWDDGWLGPKEDAGGRQVYNTIENRQEAPVEEEVEYKRNYYKPEDPDDVSALYNLITDYIDEAADLQDESRGGDATALHNERIRLRHIVAEMSAKLQELEDEYHNTGGNLKAAYSKMENELSATRRELKKAKKQLSSAVEAAAAAEPTVREGEMEEEGISLEALVKEISRLEKQNSLLQDGERKLLECLDGANTRVAETNSLLDSLQQERMTETDATMVQLQQRVRQLEDEASAMATELTMALDSAAAAIEAKNAVEQKLDRIMENAKKRKAAAASVSGPSPPTASNRTYVEGSRRTSAASSAWNEEINEEPVLQPQPVRVDQAQLEQQVLLEAYRASLRDLLERVSEYLSEAESRDRSTAVTIECLQLSIDHVNHQLEMGKKRGARGKRTNETAASDADTRTEATAASESVSVVTTRESMTESMEDEYTTAVHSIVSSSASALELAEEERRHSLIGRSSHAHSPVDPAHSNSAHIDSIQDVQESTEVRLEAGGGEEDVTQSEGEEEEIGETIQKELHATRADLSSLRHGLTSFVRDMGGWRQQVQLQQSEKEGERTEEMEHLRTEHSQLEMNLEKAQVDKEVMETELEQANQAIWQLQQAAKAAAASAAQLEQRVAAAEEAAAAAQSQLALQMEEEADARSRHERERARLREQTDELQRMLAAADAAAAATTAEAAASREATRAAKRERDRIESELSTVLEEAEGKIEQLEEDLKRTRKQAQSSEVHIARMEVELDAAKIEVARQSESLQQSATTKEETEESERYVDQLKQQVQQLQQEAAESRKEMEEMKRQLDAALDGQMGPLREITEQLELMVADVQVAKAQVVELENQLEQERQGRAADRESAAAEATEQREDVQQLVQQLHQIESEKAASAAENEKTVAEMEEKLRQSQADVEGARAAATEMQRAMLVYEQQLQQARLDQSAATATEDLKWAKAEELNQQLALRIEELEDHLQQSQVDVEASLAASSQLQQTILAMEQQLQQARLDQSAATAAEEMNQQQALRIEELEEQLQQSQVDVQSSEASASQLQQSMMAMEQEARLHQSAAAATAQLSQQQAKRIEVLEEQLQQLQRVHPTVESRATVDLEEDIARMEMELAKAQERLENAEESTSEANERAASAETAAMAARHEVAVLRSQLEREVNQQQLLQGSEEGSRREEAEERIRELEREAVERRHEIGQILEDLRSAEDQATAVAARAAVAEERVATMDNTVADLRTRLDEAMGEAESLRRSMREVHHLEAALQQAHADQSRLAADAARAKEERLVMEGEKEAAVSRLAQLSEQLSQRTEQAIRASENRNRSMSRMIELEQQMHAATAAAVAAAEPAAQVQLVAVAEAASRSASPRVSFDLGARAPSEEVAIDMPEVNATDGEEEREERDENSTLDELLPRSSLVFASTPSPNVLDQLRSWLRRQARQSRALRGNRALMPYFRYAGAVYVVFLQLALIHCWFF